MTPFREELMQRIVLGMALGHLFVLNNCIIVGFEILGAFLMQVYLQKYVSTRGLENC